MKASSQWVTSLGVLGRELTQGILQLLYPGMCAACGQPWSATPDHFCGPCRTALTTDAFAACPRCAGTMGPYALLDGGCTRCREWRLHFERALRLGPYEGLLRDVVLRLKHESGEALAEILGDLWAQRAGQRLREVGADVVIPVPLHWRRRWSRGYNQSEALARALAHSLRLPFKPGWLRRIRSTPLQTQQTPAGRRENVKGAFWARPRNELRGKTVLLVDDVLTTGSTCSDAARALRAAGAARVVAAVLAHSQG